MNSTENSQHHGEGETAVQVMDCGHPATVTEGLGTGYARTADGKTLCYTCADAREIIAFAEASVFVAYVRERDNAIITWSGGKLATITSITRGARQYTPSGGSYLIRYVRATAPDGSTWHGRGSDGHDVVALRRDRKR